MACGFVYTLWFGFLLVTIGTFVGLPIAFYLTDKFVKFICIISFNIFRIKIIYKDKIVLKNCVKVGLFKNICVNQ